MSRRLLAQELSYGRAGGRESEGTCEETDKPGRSNAPRERRTLCCLTSWIGMTANGSLCARRDVARLLHALPSRVPGERAW